MIPVPGCSPPATSTWGSVSGRQHNAARTYTQALDVPEPLQRIRAQGETEARPVRRMHHAVRTDVEWLVEELPHHRHVALAHLENVAVGGAIAT
jgi:hypothetical protein